MPSLRLPPTLAELSLPPWLLLLLLLLLPLLTLVLKSPSKLKLPLTCELPLPLMLPYCSAHLSLHILSLMPQHLGRQRLVCAFLCPLVEIKLKRSPSRTSEVQVDCCTGVNPYYRMQASAYSRESHSHEPPILGIEDAATFI
jgi:hypothetical protein